MGNHVGPPSDVFNLGAVLAFAATGEGPFGTGTTAALLYRVAHGTPNRDRVPPVVRPLIEHCLAKDLGQRPTAGGLLAEVGALQPGGDWLPDSFTRTFVPATPSGPALAAPGVTPDSGPVTRTTAAGSAAHATRDSRPLMAAARCERAALSTGRAPSALVGRAGPGRAGPDRPRPPPVRAHVSVAIGIRIGEHAPIGSLLFVPARIRVIEQVAVAATAGVKG